MTTASRKPNTEPMARYKHTEPIAAETYVAHAQAYIRSHGGLGPYIHDDDPRWLAWMAYLDRIGVKTRYVRSRGAMTVPADWPLQFDPTAQSRPQANAGQFAFEAAR